MKTIRCDGEFDGKRYSCLYHQIYDEHLGRYWLALVHGSIRWEDSAATGEGGAKPNGPSMDQAKWRSSPIMG